MGGRLFAVLVAVVVAGAGLRLAAAADPPRYHSQDERSYGRIAMDIVDRHSYGDPRLGTPLHWAPGAPLLFAATYAVVHRADAASHTIDAVPWVQAALGIALILVVALLAGLVRGPPAAVAAAAIVAFYPPLVAVTRTQQSEPLGALVLALGVLAVVSAERRGGRHRWLAAGLLLGLLTLVRADLLLLPFALAVLVALHRGRSATRAEAIPAALLAGGALLAVLPWIMYASVTHHRFIPVSDGGGSTLYVGSYLPGNGTVFGLKRHLGAETRRVNPAVADVPDAALHEQWIMDAIARRRPSLPPQTSVRRQALDLLRDDLRHHPGAYARMAARKVGRLWLDYSRGGGRRSHAWVLVLHLMLLVAAAAGLVLGLRRGPRPLALSAIAVVVAVATAVDVVLVAEPRHGLPIMPLLAVAAAVAWTRPGRPSADVQAPVRDGA